MRQFVSFLLHNRLIVLVVLGACIAIGIQSFMNLPIEAYPDVTNVQLQIITLYPGHAAEEVEKIVTLPIENEFNGIPQRISVRSLSLFGLSVVTLTFEDTADNQWVRSLAYQHLQNLSFPPTIQPSISPDQTPVGELFRYSLQAPKGFPKNELRAIQDWVVYKQFKMVPGVVDDVSFGGPTLNYTVYVDPAKLKSYNLTLNSILTGIANSNQNGGGSYIEHGSETYVVRGLGLLKNTDDIGMVAVDTRNGLPVHIKDLGKVVVGERVRLGHCTLLKKPVEAGQKILLDDDCVQGIVIGRKGENASEVVKRIEEKAKEINERYLPAGVTLVPHYDRLELIHRTVHTVYHNMVEGISLVLITLIVFLGFGNWRSAVVVAFAVPFALLGAFTLLDLKGIPANLISVGAIDFGIIVDASVVVIEQIIQLLEHRKPEERKLKHVLWQAIRDAAGHMGKPVIFSKVILLTAFIPLHTLQRVEGKIFKPMALTLTFALIVGTLFSLIFIPVLGMFAMRSGISAKESLVVVLLKKIYQPVLALVLRARYLMLLLATGGLAIGGYCLLTMGTEFLPKLDEGSLWVRVTMPEDIALSESNARTLEIRNMIGKFPEVKTIVTQTGRPDDGTDVGGFGNLEMLVDLIPREKWTTAKDREGLVEAINKEVSPQFPGIKFEFSQYIEDNVNEAVSGIKGGELGVKIYGEDPNQLQRVADDIVNTIKAVPGAVDVGSEHLLGQPQIQIIPNTKEIARLGLGMGDMQNIISTALGGAVASTMYIGERQFDLVVKMADHSVKDLEMIRNIPVLGANGERVALGNLCTVDVRAGFARIYREQNKRRIAVKFAVRDRDLGGLIADCQKSVGEKVKLPPGYYMEWTGAFENQQRAVKRLMVVVPITLALIFFELMVLFDSSFALATLIMTAVPFSAVGGIFALMLSSLNLSVSALVGFIAVSGISVQNGVLVTEAILELRKRSLPLMQAIKEGALSRVRPVVMTATMAILGLLPAALSTGIGAETARPFAVVIIGGLVTDTILTLLLVPILYIFFEPTRKILGEFDRLQDEGVMRE